MVQPKLLKAGRLQFGFDGWGLALFLLVMIPNFIWFAISAPDDPLRAASITPTVDAVGSVFQVGMVAALSCLVNRDSAKLRLTPWIVAAAGCCLLYFLCWAIYYGGITHGNVLLGLTVFPCLAFLLFAADRKNSVALLLGTGFTVCHVIHGVVNFII